MPNPYVNKVVYNGTTLIDLTSDTVTAGKLVRGATAHDNSGAPITGTAMDIPQFVITLNSSGTEISTITCDKTFSECLALLNDDGTGGNQMTNGAAITTIVPNVWTEYTTANGASSSDDDYIYYVATASHGQPLFDLIYRDTGAIDYVHPSAYAMTLNATSNGTYRTYDGGYTTVNVSVQPSISNAYTRTVVVPQQTLTPNSDRVADFTSVTPIVDGEYYIVTLDGTEYVATSETLWGDNITIGDAQVVWQTNDVTYPFAVIAAGGDQECYFTSTSQHTLKVELLEFMGGPLNLIAKPITANGTYAASDDSADGYSSVTVNVPSGSPAETWETVFNDDITVANKETFIASLADLYFEIGETWRVTLDSTEYVCEVGYYSDADVNYIGNIDLADGVDEGGELPFCFYNLGYGNLVGDVRTNGSHSLKLEKLVPSSGTNPLSGKIAVFTGDSICEGYGYSGGYAGIIGQENNMTVQNLGVGDGCIAPYSDGSGSRFVISTSVADMRADADYVILEGGCNDAGYEVPLGTLTSGYNDTLNTNTFAGAFENMLKSAIAKFPDAKIGYVFIHKCEPNFDSRTTGSYYNVAKAACEKWGIPYCDLNTQVPPLGYVSDLQTTYLVDVFHPNELGYRTFYVPKITAFMKTMLTDMRTIAKTVDSSGTYLAEDDGVDGYSSVTVSVTGSSMNVQVAQSTTRIASTSYTEACSLTCSNSGTYDVYWDCFRSSTSGTSGSQLYIGGSAYGTANTTFDSNIHVQTNHLTGVTISANQEVEVYVRSRNTSNYAYCGQLTIVQTA